MPPAPAADVVVTALPVLRVESAARSVRFYCGRLGFRQDWWHQARECLVCTSTCREYGSMLVRL